MKTIFLILIGFLVLVSCEPPTQTYKFRIINNTDKVLYSDRYSTLYPDTLISEIKAQLKVWPNTTSYQGGIISTEENTV